MGEWKKVFYENCSFYFRIIISYLYEIGWSKITVEEYLKTTKTLSIKDSVFSKNYKKEGKYPIVSQSKELISGYSDNEQLLNKIEKTIIIFGDHTQVVKYIDFDFILGADGTKIITVTEDYHPKFLYYIINSIDLHSNKYARHYSLLRTQVIPFMKDSLVLQENILSFMAHLENETITHTFYFNRKTETKITKLQKSLLQAAELVKEIETQKGYAKQLRRNILQDAIEGKLTADWRKEHPVQKGNSDYDAEALFELIQKERKVDTKRKALPPILDAEKPFELPSGWKWVRLGEIAEGFMYGTSAKSSPFGTCPVLRMGNIQDGRIDWEKLVYSNNEEEISKYALRKFDLLFNRTNSREIVGKTAIYESDKQAIYAGYLVRFRIILSNPYFINYVLNSPMHREWCNAMKTDSLGQSNINAEKLKKFVLALPPLAEQQKIVDIVSAGLDNIWELKKQISLREKYTNQLMRSILKENFNI